MPKSDVHTQPSHRLSQTLTTSPKARQTSTASALGMPFLDLGTDVLSHLFALIDVYTVLSLSRVNRLLYDIGSTKQLWLSIVRHLTACRLIDAPPDRLDELSKDALVEEVRRAVDGPRTWSPKSSVPPTLARQVVVEVDHFRCAELLPGGSHILCYFEHNSDDAVECLRHTLGDEYGHAAVVALILAASDRHELLFIELNLDTGKSGDLLRTSFPRTLLWATQLCEDFLVCYARPTPIHGRWFILLLNWRAEEFVVFDCSTTRPVDNFALLPGHIVLTRPVFGPDESSAACSVHLYSIVNFKTLWRPLSEFSFDNPIDPKEISSVELHVAHNNLVAPRHLHPKLSVTQSPIHHDTYDLTIQVADIVYPPTVPRLSSLLERLRIRPKRSRRCTTQVTLSRNHIILPPGGHSSKSSQPPQLAMKSIFRYLRDFYSTSEVGYALDCARRDPVLVHRLDDMGIGSPKQLYLGSRLYARLTPSGAIFVRETDRVVILYYQ
ncbi:hypothetical protein B0H19DRAFT_1257860 [Mycena capillaripes]|nr:hypothetical protein B0H19DRAFT_1257860 [Mycena capillaripes]